LRKLETAFSRRVRLLPYARSHIRHVTEAVVLHVLDAERRHFLLAVPLCRSGWHPDLRSPQSRTMIMVHPVWSTCVCSPLPPSTPTPLLITGDGAQVPQRRTSVADPSPSVARPEGRADRGQPHNKTSRPCRDSFRVASTYHLRLGCSKEHCTGRKAMQPIFLCSSSPATCQIWIRLRAPDLPRPVAGIGKSSSLLASQNSITRQCSGSTILR
jgi:hypothetical protein